MEVKTGDVTVQVMVRSHITRKKQCVDSEEQKHISPERLESNTRLCYYVNKSQLDADNGVTVLLTKVRNCISDYSIISITVFQEEYRLW